MSWLKKIFQPKTYATFEQNKYDINSAEYKQLKKDLKDAGIKFGHKEKVEFKKAVREGKLGAYMDSKEIDAKFKETLGLSLSSKIGKTDATQDVQEAQRLEKAAYTDEDLLNTLKATNPAIYDKVLVHNATPLNKATETKFLDVMTQFMEEDIFSEREAQMAQEIENSPFMKELDKLFAEQ